MGVYVLRAVGTDFAKIGFTDNESSNERLIACQTGCPYILEEKLFIPLGQREDETFLKRAFANKKSPAENEWFMITDDDIQGIPKYIESRVCDRAQIQIDQSFLDISDAIFILSHLSEPGSTEYILGKNHIEHVITSLMEKVS